VLDPIVIDPSLRFVGIDSGVRHSVGGASYGDVRCAAFMGYTIIAHSLGVDRNVIEDARLTDDRSQLPYKGYLCNISVIDFERRFRSVLPETILGREFIEKFGSTIDPLSTIVPDNEYRVYHSTAHPIYENHRVHEFMNIVKGGPLTKVNSIRLGQLMFESHKSYSRCGLGAERTDVIVERAKDLLNEGVYGAKITGGGSGGTVCLLVGGKAGLQRARILHKELATTFGDNLVFLE
jgi:L-arabinokinase